MDSLLAETLHWITRGIEVVGVMVILAGLAAGTYGFVTGPRGEDPEERFHLYRARLGRSILLGLEFLVAADIVNTVAVEPSLRSLAVLGGIVAIRTFLSLSLEVEIDGRWPWQKQEARREAARKRADAEDGAAPAPGPRG
ncbi:DUF1622 domain-containing protein [Frigidibacter sp.]|uniref:DUF1622 domain-containing protein n=1 Tax=Frigidibacter sp. TaxID=2586418 RepID=UPI002733CFD1|nr:DUF1622 domain-containing protein [Frigidibacter sp.]MDP3339464.1 DUF1622 domain-containing protein [Frigidibacter sp.]